MLWAQDQGLQLPVTRRNNSSVCRIEWRPAAYHTVLQILRHPVYAGAYVFGRTTQRTRIVDGRARKTTGHSKPMTAWNVLMRDHHPGYISWEQFEANQKLISENAHMQRRTERKSARGGRALLTGLVRCGRCGRTMRVFYGSQPAMRIATSAAATTATSAAGSASVSAASGWIAPSRRRSSRQSPGMRSRPPSRPPINLKADNDIRQALCRELEEARYDASLAARRYEAVDPTKRLVARELENRWNAALERVADSRSASLDMMPPRRSVLRSIERH